MIIFVTVIVAAILIYFGFSVEDKHFTLRLLFFIFAFILLFIIVPRIAITPECEMVANHTTEVYQYGNNFTGYHWDYDTGTAPDGPQTDAYLFHRNITVMSFAEVCKEPSAAAMTYYKWSLWMFVLFITYLVGFLGYQSLEYLKDWWQAKRQ